MVNELFSNNLNFLFQMGVMLNEIVFNLFLQIILLRVLTGIIIDDRTKEAYDVWMLSNLLSKEVNLGFHHHQIFFSITTLEKNYVMIKCLIDITVSLVKYCSFFAIYISQYLTISRTVHIY